ncbi:hypothetical protein [Lysobacter antibioticus]|uniref:Uncharacterized protein n=1 Tax=Lysobacter antibioticus TaxID=84531 RepID=A0A0S2FDF5_LYSAN|nr:hypothetical protein [Lysobacter antibioticus]ALN81542.1 hypothetical protein LA76x_3416 [Lysobacter antibioticus]
MKKLCLSIVLLMASSSVFANEFIPYYGNNPFLFCKIGVPQDCWRPVNPATGDYQVVNRKCFNPYSANLFARVCKQAFLDGKLGDADLGGEPPAPTTDSKGASSTSRDPARIDK